MTCSSTMRRITWLSLGLGLAIASAAALASPRIGFRHANDVRVGTGHAYARLGDLPVKHRDRVKPFGSMAIEEVKRIYGRSTITLLGPDGKTTSSWEPVAALLDWSARPEFWDDQDFILVEDLSLRRLILRAWIRAQLRSLAGEDAPLLSRVLHSLAAQPELTEADLQTAARQAGEASTTGKRLNSLASKIGEDYKWLSPRVLENTQFQHEGHALTLPQWVGEILDKKDRARSDGTGAAPKLSLIEEQATEVGERLVHFQAIRDHNGSAIKPLDLLVVPRPFDEIYRQYSTEAFEKGIKSDQTLSPLEANVANTLVEYLQGMQSKDWALPGEDAVFDQKFTLWLGESSPWIPLGVLLVSDESELSRAGLPLEQVVAFRKSYRDLEAAERAAPGDVPEPVAVAMIAAARDLGTSLGEYPESAAMARESRLNRIAPFSKAPVAYGFGLVFMLLSFGITSHRRTAAGKPSAALYYCLGIAGLMAGIALQLYGFVLRFRISRWGPVTHMYETVTWVALATAALGLAFELFWRKKYAALAASGIALLAAVLAENGSILDPNIRVVLPVLRLNRWLVSHVLTIVSSYAAFALALGLGLLAVGHYLTATYRRSPSYRELAWPLLPGIPLYALGCFGMASPYRLWPRPVLDPRLLDYVSSGLAVIGGLLAIVGGFSLLGELANRSPRRACILGLVVAALCATGVMVGTSGAVQGPLENALTSYDLWLVGLVGGALTVMGLLGVQAREAPARIESLANFIDRTIWVGVLLLAAGTILGGAWARNTWNGFWALDIKMVFALITLLVYLVPLFSRLAGWMSTFGLVAASVVGFTAVLITWYGLNFVFRVGQHTYGFTEGGSRRLMIACALALVGIVGAAAWRRSRSQ
jgi:hypothetical protein